MQLQQRMRWLRNSPESRRRWRRETEGGMEPRTGCGGFACLAPIILRCVHTAMMFEVVALWWSVAWRWRRLIWRKAMREKGKKLNAIGMGIAVRILRIVWIVGNLWAHPSMCVARQVSLSLYLSCSVIAIKKLTPAQAQLHNSKQRRSRGGAGRYLE